jgi:guanylate kinase
VRRLRERKTEPEAQLKMRIATARQELKRLDLFDYMVVNADNELDETCRKIMAIITAEKSRVRQREYIL